MTINIREKGMQRTLTNEQVRDMRRLARPLEEGGAGLSMYAVAKRFGMPYKTVWMVVKGVTYSDVTDVERKDVTNFIDSILTKKGA